MHVSLLHVFSRLASSFMFHYWLLCHCPGVPQFIFPFTNWRTYWLLPSFGNYEKNCCKYLYAGFHMGLGFQVWSGTSNFSLTWSQVPPQTCWVCILTRTLGSFKFEKHSCRIRDPRPWLDFSLVEHSEECRLTLEEKQQRSEQQLHTFDCLLQLLQHKLFPSSMSLFSHVSRSC